MSDAALALTDVTVRRSEATLLSSVHWEVRAGERWVVLGPNGSGKTTLMAVAGAYLFPSRGTVDVLGHRLGRVDVRRLRGRIGHASSAVAQLLPPRERALDVVVTARRGALRRWRDDYTSAELDRARTLLGELGCAGLDDRVFSTLSEGERKRVQIARTLMAEPELLLLDEPAAGLDLGGREALVARLGRLAADSSAPTTVLVTHHVEEIPPAFTHALLLRGGRVLRAGPLREVLTAPALSACFGTDLVVEERDGRWWARTGR